MATVTSTVAATPTQTLGAGMHDGRLKKRNAAPPPKAQRRHVPVKQVSV